MNSVALPCLQIPKLIHCFSSLEELTLINNILSLGNDDGLRASQRHSFDITGSLSLALLFEMGTTVCRLLDLPNGLHFRKINFLWAQEEAVRWVVELVVRCSHTLEFIDITCLWPGMFVFVPR